jgi:hypothetical protein
MGELDMEQKLSEIKAESAKLKEQNIIVRQKIKEYLIEKLKANDEYIETDIDIEQDEFAVIDIEEPHLSEIWLTMWGNIIFVIDDTECDFEFVSTNDLINIVNHL